MIFNAKIKAVSTCAFQIKIIVVIYYNHNNFHWHNISICASVSLCQLCWIFFLRCTARWISIFICTRYKKNMYFHAPHIYYEIIRNLHSTQTQRHLEKKWNYGNEGENDTNETSKIAVKKKDTAIKMVKCVGISDFKKQFAMHPMYICKCTGYSVFRFSFFLPPSTSNPTQFNCFGCKLRERHYSSDGIDTDRIFA